MREPAPVGLSGEPEAAPVPSQPVELPQPVVSGTAEGDAAEQPRRSGWWRKRNWLGKRYRPAHGARREHAMKSAWIDRDAQAMVDRYARDGVGTDLALRVYTTRLLGRDPRLVLHGGGNTSVKTTIPDLLGEATDVICVKGSGADMADIEPSGLPAVRLDRLRKLRAREALSDEDMVRVQRENLLDPAAPNPSVETLLHAFLPHKFVDHTHSTAVLSLVDQPDGEAICAEVYDGRASVVPYIMPGFALAKAAADVFEKSPDVEGLILHKHGIFTFGDTRARSL